MNNFIFENKTKVYFGKGIVKEHFADLLANYGETVMLAYGGGSIKRNGVYDEIMGILNAAGKRVVEFSGIMSNPTYAKVQEGAKLARENHVDLILAVGGGSVSDCCKVISAQVNLNEDIWEMQYTKHTLPTKFIPLGTIVTVFGTGSEMSNGAARFAHFTRSVCVASHPRAVTKKPHLPVSTRWPRSSERSVCRPALQNWVSPPIPISVPSRIPSTSRRAAARS